MIHSFIITGFLGAGKSTLLVDTVQKHFKNKKIALIVNEFGEIGVDQNILKNVHSDVIEISDGCICCQLAEEFESGVIEIIGKYDPDIIFVETAGVTEPFPVFLSLQNLAISVDGVICVIDAKNYDSYMHNSTAKYQVGGSNIIVLNKTDLVEAHELEQAKKDIIAIKEKHNIKNTFTGKTVFNNYFLHTAEQGVVGQEVFEGVYQTDEIVGLAQGYQHDAHTIHDAITQNVAHINKEIIFNDVDALLNDLPKNIYRVKGIIRTIDIPTPIIVNYSFGHVSFEELPDYQEESILVFIGEDINNEVTSLNDRYDFLTVQHSMCTVDHHHDHDHSHPH